MYSPEGSLKWHEFGFLGSSSRHMKNMLFLHCVKTPFIQCLKSLQYYIYHFFYLWIHLSMNIFQGWVQRKAWVTAPPSPHTHTFFLVPSFVFLLFTLFQINMLFWSIIGALVKSSSLRFSSSTLRFFSRSPFDVFYIILFFKIKVSRRVHVLPMTHENIAMPHRWGERPTVGITGLEDQRFLYENKIYFEQFIFFTIKEIVYIFKLDKSHETNLSDINCLCSQFWSISFIKPPLFSPTIFFN